MILRQMEELKMRSIRKKYSAQEKARIALEALKENLTYNELTKKYGAHSTQIAKWKKRLKEGISGLFLESKKQVDRDKDQLIDELYNQVGQLTIQINWLKKKSDLFKD